MEFERNPWLLVPIVILTMEGWTALKTFIRSARARRADND